MKVRKCEGEKGTIQLIMDNEGGCGEFLTRRGRAVGSDRIYRIFKKARVKAGAGILNAKVANAQKTLFNG